MTRTIVRLFVLAAMASAASVAFAAAGKDVPPGNREAGALKLAYVFDDHMVLQRDVESPVWGWAKPGSRVTVAFAGQERSAAADARGKWIVRLAPMKADAAAQSMTVSDGESSIVLEDLLVGDVWILAGQSNMETKAGGLTVYGKDTKNPISGDTVKSVIDHCNETIFNDLDEPRLRYIQVPRCTGGPAPQDDFDRANETGVWGNPAPVMRKWVTAESVEKGGQPLFFSAIGFVFGREIVAQYGVPVGLVDTSKGGTLISTWMSEKAVYESCDFGKRRVLERRIAVKNWENYMAARDDNAEFTDFLAKLDASRAAYRKALDTEPVRNFLAQHEDNRTIARFVEAVAKFDAEYAEYVKQPFAQRVAARDVGPIPPRLATRDTASLKPPGTPGIRNTAFKIPDDPRLNTSYTANLYHGTICPLQPLGIKGAIWYQGENNHFDDSGAVAQQYDLLLRGLIRNWRQAWAQGDFPFYIVQLPNTPALEWVPEQPDDGPGWVVIADGQRRAVAEPNTALAVTNDIGGDLHWQNKYDLGVRLARIARAQLFGESDLVYSGPLYKSHEIVGDKVLIRFDHVGGGIMSGIKDSWRPARELKELQPYHRYGSGDLQYFQISDGTKDSKGYVWKWATANIVGKDAVEVFHPDVKQPKAVRYGWAKFASGTNFYNREGLPAATFRTDQWDRTSGWALGTIAEDIAQRERTCAELNLGAGAQ